MRTSVTLTASFSSPFSLPLNPSGAATAAAGQSHRPISLPLSTADGGGLFIKRGGGVEEDRERIPSCVLSQDKNRD